ncbi:MAG: aminoacetone oxidase family FAD-binding enzyme [Azospirillum brasilense]|nr:MAG: aminoacetone oxidase family FAD-binding enzyme [Azospirillum brasilense]
MQPHSAPFVIIGAGPSGLMAAETIAAQGYAVQLFDRMPSPARKFLLAGRGGLNLTHSEPLEHFLPRYGTAQPWLEPSVRAFSPEMLRAWCEGLGQETFVGSSGRVFPKAMKAAPLLRVWLQRLQALGVQYYPRHRWIGWYDDQLLFEDGAQQQVAVRPPAALLALGGASWPRLGSDGNWVSLLAARGVPITPLAPANAGFKVAWSAYFRERFAGQPLKPLAMTHGVTTQQGEAMITEDGIEGGLVYALGARLRDTINHAGKAAVTLDLRPTMTQASLAQKFALPRRTKSFSSYLRSAGFSPLAVALLHEAFPKDALQDAYGDALAAMLKAVPLTLRAPTGMARAISTAGGIAQQAVDERFMLRSMPGLFVAGEMLDWEAPTGGYLLQGCFSTAVAAARGMVQYATAATEVPHAL